MNDDQKMEAIYEAAKEGSSALRQHLERTGNDINMKGGYVSELFSNSKELFVHCCCYCFMREVFQFVV